MVSIRDVARLAGVSLMTVSRVINETGYVSAKTKEKVLAAISETGYKVNQTAVGLRTGKTNSIGVIISDITNPFFAFILKGIDHVCSENNYDTILFNTGEDPKKELRYIDLLRQKSVRGIIISSCISDYKRNKGIFTGLIPVFFNRMPAGIEADAVLNNNAKDGYTAAEYLIKTGHRKIAFINGNPEMSTFKDRYLGFQNAMKKYEIPVSEELIVNGDYSIEGGYRSTEKTLSASDPPDAIFPTNNFMTQGMYTYLKENKINVPEDISVVGHGDYAWCRLIDPPMTVVEHEKFGMGKRAAEILFERLQRSTNKPYRKVILEPELIIRHSVKNYA
jgi:DNA-binding LacI/PurR family transcriptional regulator